MTIRASVVVTAWLLAWVSATAAAAPATVPIEWNKMASGSMGEPPYAPCFTYGAPAIEWVRFSAPRQSQRCQVIARVIRPPMSRTMPVVTVVLDHLDRPDGEWRRLELTRSPDEPREWRGTLQAASKPAAYALLARDASGHLAVRLPAIAGEPVCFPLLDDPDESPTLVTDDMDVRRVSIGNDGKWLYLRIATQAPPTWGSTKPMDLHVFGMGTLQPGMTYDAVRQLIAFGPALKMVGMPPVIVASPHEFRRGPKLSDQAEARLTDTEVRLRVRLDALQRDGDGSVLASFVSATFYSPGLTVRDGTVPVRIYLPTGKDKPVSISAPPPKLTPLVESGPVPPSTRPAGRTDPPIAIVDAANLKDDDPNFPARTGTTVRRIQARPAGERLIFAVIGDSMSHDTLYRYLLERVEDLGAKLLLHVGDFATIGTEERYRNMMEISADCRVPWLTVLGNHDTIKNRQWRQHLRFFGPPDYWFDYGPARFVVLNVVPGRFTVDQLDALDRLLATPLRKFVLMHRPLYYLSRDWSTPVTGGDARFKEIVERHRVDRVISGHIHLHSRKVVGGVTYIVTGGGGQALDIRGKGGVFHLTLFSVSKDAVHDMAVLPGFSPLDPQPAGAGRKDK